jgi:hypothetical protein
MSEEKEIVVVTNAMYVARGAHLDQVVLLN